jgi:hypothetical protein
MQNYNPYSSNNNPYQNNQNQFDEGLNKQRQIIAEQTKLRYKSEAENALDNIVYEYQNAITNQIQNWKINISNKASIVRYYKRYWDNKAFMLSIIILFATFIASFYTKFAVIGILITFTVQYFYSAKYFFVYFTNDHELKKEDSNYLQNEIFGYQFNTKLILIVTSILTIVSVIMGFYSSNILIDFTQYSKLVKILHLNIQNELFAYTNTFSIFILIIIKIVEKWK